jgi:N-acetylglutamate synthase
MDQTDIRRLECLAFNAWPALRTVLRDGWVLRFADGHTKRANSANALWPGTAPLAGRLDAFETDYRRAGLTPVFRLTPLAEPGLDDALAARGYARFDDSLVMAGDLPKACVAPPTPSVHIDLDPDPEAGWLDDLARAADAGAREHAILARMLACLVPPAVFVRVVEGGAPLAFAMGAVEDGHLGIFEVLTVPHARGRGLARRALDALFAWAARRGATRAYLQVAEANAPARALYARHGLSTAYRYHYRRAP